MEVAERYFADVEKTCRQLAKHPQSGARYDSGIGQLEGLRRFPVSGGFEQYLVFYLPRVGGNEVVRVLHGARDTTGSSPIKKHQYGENLDLRPLHTDVTSNLTTTPPTTSKYYA